MGYKNFSDGSSCYIPGKGNLEVTVARNKHIEEIFKFTEGVNIKSASIQEFVDSLRDFYFSKNYLTDKQYEALLNIYERL